MDADGLLELLAKLKAAGIGAAAVTAARWLFKNDPGDIPVCHTRIIRIGLGLPWEKRMFAHPQPDSGLKLTEMPNSEP